jgi:hypothetical protein
LHGGRQQDHGREYGAHQKTETLHRRSGWQFTGFGGLFQQGHNKPTWRGVIVAGELARHFRLAPIGPDPADPVTVLAYQSAQQADARRNCSSAEPC